MTYRTILDDIFAPIFPSIKLLFYKLLMSIMLRKKYADLEEERLFKKAYREFQKEMTARHKLNTEKLDKLCSIIRNLHNERYL